MSSAIALGISFCHHLLATLRPCLLPAILLISGCLGAFQIPETPLQAPQFGPDVFFAGITHGDGTIATRGRATRHFIVAGLGHTETDGTFVLDQTVTYDDGSVEHRTFRLRQIGEHEYTGSLTGASNEVSARSDGNRFHARYTIRKPAVTMDQWLYLQEDGRTVSNRGTVSVLGIPVAHLSETIRRE